jgi:hypothetical protein
LELDARLALAFGAFVLPIVLWTGVAFDFFVWGFFAAI